MLILGLITGFIYLLCGVWLIYNLFTAKIVQDEPNKLIFAGGFLAAIFHAAILLSDTFTPAGINPSIFNSFSIVSWLTVMLYLFAESRKPVETLGIFIFPVTTAAIFMQLLWPQNMRLSELSFELKLHILLSLLAYGLLAVAASQSVLLAVQTHFLKSRHPGGFIRSLPPLQSMETLLFQMIYTGFIVLTLALLSGFIYLDNIFAQHLVHKTVLSIVAWVLFAILLWGRWHYGWRGKKAVNFTISGFIFLMLAYFGSKAVLEIILQKI
jgi:ABC-type uncharacterized transport system permease subunit